MRSVNSKGKNVMKTVLFATIALVLPTIAHAQTYTTRQGLGGSMIFSGSNGYNATVQPGLGGSTVGRDNQGNTWTTRPGLGGSTLTTVQPGYNRGW
jgi:hypothetical protein